jgi:2-polyprenyl-3-methyl-5-hydroxy-6-metoxy-1,4-benzoquinol methylase
VTHTDRRTSQTQEKYAADDLETMQEATRYGAHVYELIKNYVGSRVLEVGSGIGTISRRLVDDAELVVGIEPNPNCIGPLTEAMGGHPRFVLKACHLEECDRGELAARRFDTVVCVNVLEHIEDHVEALKIFRETIVRNGHVVIFVPAVPAAYGPLDAELGHYRRYAKADLARAFAAAGLRVLKLRYTNPIGLAGWMYNSHVTGSRAHSPYQVKLFDRLIAPWALPIDRLIAPPIGLSLVGVSVRPD